MSRTRRRRLLDTPPLTGIGILWPWLTPWRASTARGSREAVDPASPTFRLVSANALGPNRRADKFAAAITAVDTDVLVVVEASDAILDALDTVEVSRLHRHGLVEHRPRWGGCGMWSKHPIELIEAGDAGYAYLAARVDLPAGPVTVVAVHTIAPAKPGTGRGWLASFAVLTEVLGRLPGPLVAAGDYNATLGHRPLRDLLARSKLRDAHTVAGRGLARTWPVSRVLPPLALIDRVLVSDEIGVVSIEERAMPGSDHRAVIATLAIRCPAPARPG